MRLIPEDRATPLSKGDAGKRLLAWSYLLWIVGTLVGIWLAFGPRHFGAASLIATASFWCGMLLGFLFGIPKLVTTGSGSSTDEKGEKKEAPTALWTRYQPNTNLTDISDWLTKIIVGLGLVNLGKIPGAVESLAQRGAEACDASTALVAATMVASSIIGVFVGYLTTRIFWSPQLSLADQEADRRQEERSEQERAVIKEGVANVGSKESLSKEDAWSRLCEKADEYLKIDDPDATIRTSTKTRLASEMGGIILQGGLDRDQLAQETSEGILVGLANAMISLPVRGDMDRLLSFAPNVNRLHVQYAILLAYLELLKNGLVSAADKSRMLRIVDLFERRADADLKRLIDQVRRAAP